MIRLSKSHPLTPDDCAVLRAIALASLPPLIALLVVLTIRQIIAFEAALAAAGV